MCACCKIRIADAVRRCEADAIVNAAALTRSSRGCDPRLLAAKYVISGGGERRRPEVKIAKRILRERASKRTTSRQDPFGSSHYKKLSMKRPSTIVVAVETVTYPFCWWTSCIMQAPSWSTIATRILQGDCRAANSTGESLD